ncbi:MAG TPA: cytochrome c [Allosphingosinicella sp.]|jgi:mono/diheme cytochrome c family protein
MSVGRAVRRGLAVIGILILLLIAIVVGTWIWAMNYPREATIEPTPATLSILAGPIADGPQAALLRRGRYLAVAGDCVSCHTRKGGAPFAGGLGLGTPFGLIYAPNITGDPETGIGNWTPDQFYRALTRGVDDEGHRLYPAFPYPWFTRISRADSDAILAWLKTVPAVRYMAPGNRLPFPADIRLSIAAWDGMFFRPGRFVADPKQSPDWNRGAYYVNGLGHCGACHTPLNLAGAARNDRFLQGSNLNQWVAPDLTGNERTGLGRWSVDELVEYLRTGRNAHANASGPMAEVVAYSTSFLSDADLRAAAIYLKSLKPSPDTAAAAPDPAAMRRGAGIFSDACASCHLADGSGQPRLFPPLPGSAVAQQRDPTGLLHLILAGGRTAPTPTRPAPLTMPSFAWKLSDQEAADVATYLRNSWGNRAAPVSASDAAHLRKALRLTAPLAIERNQGPNR